MGGFGGGWRCRALRVPPGYLLVIRAGLGVGGGWVRKKLILNIIPQKIQQKKNPSAKKKSRFFVESQL